MLLTVFALVGAVFKGDLRNNVFNDVASGVACPPQWLPVVLAAGVSPQPPWPVLDYMHKSRWSDAMPVAKEANRGRLLSHATDVCQNNAGLGCAGNKWNSPTKCCTECV